jgi:hypothetical protein
MLLTLWQILRISVYLESAHIPKVSFGNRATVYPGPAPLQDIFEAEVAGKQVKKVRDANPEQDTKTQVEQVGRDTKKLVEALGSIRAKRTVNSARTKVAGRQVENTKAQAGEAE